MLQNRTAKILEKHRYAEPGAGLGRIKV